MAEGVGLTPPSASPLRGCNACSLCRCAPLELRSNPTSNLGPAALDLNFRTGGGGGIRTHGALRLSGFQDRRNRPLYHPSKFKWHRSQRLP